MSETSKRAGRTAREKHWHAHVASWRASGLSQMSYARQAGIHHNTLGYWKRKFERTQPGRSRPLVVPVPADILQGCTPAETLGAPQRGAFRLHLEAYVLEVPPDFAAPILERILDCLEQRQ